MLATKISFINEIANLCESYGADVDQVRRGMCADQRIGNQFLYPGLGYGGSCFPKDVLAVIAMGERQQTPLLLLRAVHEVNNRQRCAFVVKIDRHYGVKSGNRSSGRSETGESNLAGKNFAVWGIAFKPGTDDIREAPSITIMEHLLQHGATVTAHDPVAIETCRQVLGDRVAYSEDLMAVLDGADALVVCTDWDDFKRPNFDQMKKRMKTPVIFDGRNLYRRATMKEQGFTYYCIGRDPVVPEDVSGGTR